MLWFRKNQKKIVIEVDGIRCPHCEASIKVTLYKIINVRRVMVRSKKFVWIYTSDKSQINSAELVKAIENIGYRVTAIES